MKRGMETAVEDVLVGLQQQLQGEGWMVRGDGQRPQPMAGSDEAAAGEEGNG